MPLGQTPGVDLPRHMNLHRMHQPAQAFDVLRQRHQFQVRELPERGVPQLLQPGTHPRRDGLRGRRIGDLCHKKNVTATTDSALPPADLGAGRLWVGAPPEVQQPSPC